MNPIEMIKGLMGKGQNPQQMVMNMIGNKNPMVNNLMQMAQKGDTQSIEKFAENLYKEKYPNKNFREDFSAFMQNIKSQNQTKQS